MSIVMIHSYKGGSGKTLFSINFANILRKTYSKRVLLIEADFSMPVFTSIFTDYSPDIFFNDYLNGESVTLQQCIYPNYDDNLGIIYCNPHFNPNDKILTTDPEYYETMVLKLSQNLKELKYDFVIFDLSPGKNLFAASILILSNKIFTILRPDKYSVIGIKSLFQEFYSSVSRLQNKEFHIILNQVPQHRDMLKIIEPWKQSVIGISKGIASFNLIDFDHNTGFFVASNNLVLDLENPTSKHIAEIINNHIIS